MALPRRECFGRTRANHRSRPERAILHELGERLGSALEICESGTGEDAAIAWRPRITERPSMHQTQPRSKGSRFSANAGPAPELFYAPSTAVGVGLPQRRGHLCRLHPNAEMRTYSVQQLSDYARAQLLGGLADTLRPGESPPDARQRFNELLSRVQQRQVAQTIKAEVLTSRPDAMWTWNKNNWHLVPVERNRSLASVDAWAQYIRNDPTLIGRGPHPTGVSLEIVEDRWAQRH